MNKIAWKSSKRVQIVFLFVLCLIFLYILKRQISRHEQEKTRQFLPKLAEIELFYGVIDAGSTGSRLYMYKVKKTTTTKLEYLKFPNGTFVSHKITPGLSDFNDDLDGAVNYVLSLLKWLESSVDSTVVSKTKVSILATAGMRLLPLTHQKRMVDKLKKDLPSRSPIKIAEIRVIPGIMEGVYQWVANNYLSGKIDYTHHKDLLPSSNYRRELPSTNGIVELGGASLQIVYEKAANNFFNNIFTYWNAKHRRKFKFKLHAESLLGYGMQSMLNWYLSPLNIHSTMEQKSACLLKNGRKTVHYHPNGANANEELAVTVVGKGDFELCLHSLEDALVKSGKILQDSSLGLHFPSNVSQVSNRNINNILNLNIPDLMELDGFSEFFYGSFEFYSFDHPFTSGNSNLYAQKAKEFCKSYYSNILYRLRQGLFNTRNEENILNQCFKSAYILIINKIICKKGNRLTPRFQYGNKEVQWTYGALIDYLSRTGQ